MSNPRIPALTPAEREAIMARIRENQAAVRRALPRPMPPADDRPTLPPQPPPARRPVPRRAPWMPPPDDSPTLPPATWRK